MSDLDEFQLAMKNLHSAWNALIDSVTEAFAKARGQVVEGTATVLDENRVDVIHQVGSRSWCNEEGHIYLPCVPPSPPMDYYPSIPDSAE